MEEYSRKRKRDNYSCNIFIQRKRKIEDDDNNIIINKFKKIDNINFYINSKKRIHDDIDDYFDNNKKNKTYNCFIHDNLKEVCNIYQCSGTIFINTNENIMYQYIK